MKPICLFVNLLLISFIPIYAQTPFSLKTKSQKRIDSLKSIPIRLIAQDYYSKNLGFICKKEWQLEKAAKVPFRFRLGSLDYVNSMEGKGGGFRQPPQLYQKN